MSPCLSLPVRAFRDEQGWEDVRPRNPNARLALLRARAAERGSTWEPDDEEQIDATYAMVEALRPFRGRALRALEAQDND
jgi:hypothetical protein